MKKILIVAAAFAVLLSGPAVAGTQSGLTANTVMNAGFDRLTETQKADIIRQVAASATPATNTEDTIDKIDRWSQVGANLGKGLAATAKELGVAVNEFAATPMGKVATALIVWHIMGASIMHIIGAFLIWGIGIVAIRYIVERSYPTKYTYDLENKNVFGNHPVKTKVRDELSSEMVVVLVISHAVVLGAGTWIMFTM